MTLHQQDLETRHSQTLLLLALGLVFAWRFLLSAHVNLIPDECSYWAWSRRLDWSYFDNSGMVAYLIRISTSLFGYSTPLSVRFPFLLLSALSSGLIYLCSLNLFGNRRHALVTVFVFNMTPVALLGGSAAIHDNALVFFTILSLWSMTKYLSEREDIWLYITGLATGLSIMSKYTGIINLLCVFVFLLSSKELRRVLLTSAPWIGAGLALLFTIPIIYWNWTHDWASVSHILFIGSGAVSVTRRIEDGLGFNIAQFFLVSPVMYVFLLVSIVTALWHNLRKPNLNHLLCLSFGLPLALFGIQSFRGHVEANWSIPGYIGPLLLCVWSYYGNGEGALNVAGGHWDKKFVKWSLASSLGIAGLVVLHAWIGIIPASLERSVSKADRIIWETRGWDKLGRHVNDLIQKDEVIAADSYQLCALLEFNIPGQPEVRYLAPWGRPTQFDVWHQSFDDLAGRTIIYVSPKPLAPTSTALVSIYENFASVEALPIFDVMYHGESIREIYIYRCRGFNPYEPRRLGPRSLFYRDY